MLCNVVLAEADGAELHDHLRSKLNNMLVSQCVVEMYWGNCYLVLWLDLWSPEYGKVQHRLPMLEIHVVVHKVNCCIA